MLIFEFEVNAEIDFIPIYIWALTWDFQQFSILTWIDSDEPAQPHVKLNSHTIFQWPTKALIRLCVCACWSEPLLVAHTTLLEISCCCSFIYFSILTLGKKMQKSLYCLYKFLNANIWRKKILKFLYYLFHSISKADLKKKSMIEYPLLILILL